MGKPLRQVFSPELYCSRGGAVGGRCLRQSCTAEEQEQRELYNWGACEACRCAGCIAVPQLYRRRGAVRAVQKEADPWAGCCACFRAASQKRRSSGSCASGRAFEGGCCAQVAGLYRRRKGAVGAVPGGDQRHQLHCGHRRLSPGALLLSRVRSPSDFSLWGWYWMQSFLSFLPFWMQYFLSFPFGCKISVHSPLDAIFPFLPFWMEQWFL